MSIKKRQLILFLILIGVTALTVFLFLPWRDPLSELKRTEETTEGAEEAKAVVHDILEAVKEKNTARIYDCMLVRDSTETKRILEPLVEDPPMGDPVFLGSSTLVHSSAKGNLTLHVWSAARGKGYAFLFKRDSRGRCKLAGIGASDRKPKD